MKKLIAGGLGLFCLLLMTLIAACGGAAETRPQEQSSMVAADPACPAAESTQAVSDSAYAKALQQRFAHWAFYPSEALNAGQTGQVLLCVQLDRNGRILRGRVAQSSGFPELDGAALYALGLLDDSEELGSLPDSLAPGRAKVWLTFPVNFAPPPPAYVKYVKPQAPRPCLELREARACPANAACPKASASSPAEQVFSRKASTALLKEIRFPKEAMKSGTNGQATLCVSADAQGKILDATVLSDSGSAILDGSALMAIGMVQLNAGLPPVPAEVLKGREHLLLTWPINWEVNYYYGNLDVNSR